MASNFLQSTRDHRFILKEWLDMSRVFDTERYKNSYGVDDLDMILDNALKVAREVVAPTNDEGDSIHATYNQGEVKVPPSFKDVYFFVQENGLGSSNKNHHDESALPCSVMACINEYLIGANAALGPYFLATTGSSGLIQNFGSEQVKSIFLPRMFSGQWSGTMDLTEPGGGSDVGDILTRAYPTEDPGIYKIKGTKCFITGGDQDITENIVHLTLARVEGAAPGTKGISLFVVPKYWTDDKGNNPEFNDVTCVGIEHKMGLSGSATAVINFGEQNNCRGYLLGNPPDDNGKAEGMAQMFNMMNEERLITGLAAAAQATVAYNNAVQYAAQRVQGRPLTNPRAGRVPIIQHEDVRRMLLFQKAHLDAFRAMIVYTNYQLDIAENSNDAAEAKRARAIIEVNTPIVKAFCSDMSFLCISEAMQVYGGYGYSEEYPVAQLMRDSRIYPIWEGTNYIQAMDLIGRKWMMGKGQVFAAWLQDIQDLIDNSKGFESELKALGEALQAYRDIQMTMGGYLGQGKMSMIGIYATRILHATGKLYSAKLLMEQALIAARKLEETGPDHFDAPFYKGKIASAQFFVHNILPEIYTTLQVIKKGDTSVLDIDEKSFLF
ncbi:MAG TPA: acyl-CoA dehydrogenase [Syntrophomonadaceae bacterium]|nr:acyl-CoA dehydrogenase [Syntrophomonadaceae bacterium]